MKEKEYSRLNEKTTEQIFSEINKLAAELKDRHYTGQGVYEKASRIFYMTEGYNEQEVKVSNDV